MKALSIKQPWAGLIAAGLKPIENRTWVTKHRGPLAIHVSGKIPFKPTVWDQFCEDHPEAAGIDYETLLAQCGKIICTVDLVDCVPIDRLPTDKRNHWTAEGPFCWIVENPLAFDGQPVVKGKLMLWEYGSSEQQIASDRYRECKQRRIGANMEYIRTRGTQVRSHMRNALHTDVPAST